MSSSSNGSSSESPASMESDSPETYKTACKAKKFHKHHTKPVSAPDCKGKQQSSCLLGVFQRHYNSLVSLIKTCPIEISSELFAKGFISEDTLNQVITGQDSQVKKAALLLCDVRAHLKVNPEAFTEFVSVLEQEKSFDFLASKMKGKRSEYLNSNKCIQI